MPVVITAVTGYMWGENIGWINLNPNNEWYGVVNDEAGNLSGYAWGENVGWISFSGNGYGETTVSIRGIFLEISVDRVSCFICFWPN